MNAFLLIPIAAFVGSFHCAAMCGPFVSYYSLHLKPVRLGHHVAYQTGRLVAYLALGSLAGLLGQSVLSLGAYVATQKTLAIVMGAGMILIGIAHYHQVKLPMPSPFLKRLMAARVQATTPMLIGLLSTLLPCGYLYAFAFASGITGHPVSGSLAMAAFWLGTLPATLLIGLIGQKLGPTMWRYFERATPAFLIVFGVLAIWGKWVNFSDLKSGFEQLCQSSW